MQIRSFLSDEQKNLEKMLFIHILTITKKITINRIKYKTALLTTKVTSVRR